MSDRPMFEGLPVSHWEIKQLFDKEEDFSLKLDEDGNPIVVEEWVLLYLLAPGGVAVRVEIDKEPFDEYLLPRLIDPMIRFWRSVRVGDALFPKRAGMLDMLLAEKSKHEKLCG